MGAGVDNVLEVLRHALQKGGSAQTPASSRPALTDTDTTGSVLDALSLEDAKAYQQKTSFMAQSELCICQVCFFLSLDTFGVQLFGSGKYVSNTLRAVSDACFWYLMRVAHETRQPLLHFYRMLDRRPQPDKIQMPVVDLLCRDMCTVMAEFESLLSGLDGLTQAAAQEASQVSPQGLAEDVTRTLADVALLLLLHNAAAFSRRVCLLFSRTSFFLGLSGDVLRRWMATEFL